MKKILVLCFIFSVFSAAICSCNNPQKPAEKPVLTKAWETEAIFKIPESVCFDPQENVLYVSNVNGNPTDKDMNGFISKCGPDGTVIELEWATGMHAPKGMGIYDGKLYTSDIDRVAEIDLKSGDILQFYDMPGSSFLNDIAIDSKGNVYISDMMDTKIYRISGGLMETWLDDPVLTGPNGLFVDEGFLMIGCKKIVKAKLEDKTMSEWLLDTGGIDGLEGVGDGRYLFSDWQGNVYLVDQEKKIEKLLDLTTQQKNAADIEFIPSQKMLLVPTFGANTVAAYTLEN